MASAGALDEAPASPRITIAVGATFLLGRDGEATLREITLDKRHPRSGGTASRLQFTDGAGMPVFLTDAQISSLARDGAFRPYIDADGDPVPTQRRLIDLSESELARCTRMKAYVDKVLELGKPHCTMKIHVDKAASELAASRGELGNVPPYTTIREWIDKWKLNGATAGIACFARKVPVPAVVTPSLIDEAVRYGVNQVLCDGKASGAAALEKAQEWLVLVDRESLFDELPDLRTFQRRLKDVPRSVRLEGEYGPLFAERATKISYERPRPINALEEVEVDHTPLDLLVLSDDEATILGRPDVISFRDRYSGCCLGLSIGFEAPSFASFVDGLRHAIYEKKDYERLFPSIERPWFCWGRFRRLYVDNALHFIGSNIAAAAQELNFQIAETRPGNPWLKGAQEKMFADLNMQVHNLPGSTYSNILERRDRRELAKIPVLKLAEVRAYLFKWICDEYHVNEREGLGPLRTMKGIPRALWDRSVEKLSIPLPPQEQVFDALVGDRHLRAINGNGIRLDYITYGSARLEAIRNHPRHRDGAADGLVRGTKHEGSRYVVTRKAFDLSSVWVRDPYTPGTPAIEVPAMRQDYARGLTLFQHLVNLNNADKALLADRAKDPVDELMRARARVNQAVSLVRETRRNQQVERRLARHQWAGQQRELRSRVERAPVDGEASAGSLLLASKRAKNATGNAVPIRGGGDAPSWADDDVVPFGDADAGRGADGAASAEADVGDDADEVLPFVDGAGAVVLHEETLQGGMPVMSGSRSDPGSGGLARPGKGASVPDAGRRAPVVRRPVAKPKASAISVSRSAGGEPAPFDPEAFARDVAEEEGWSRS